MADNPYSPYVDRSGGSVAWGANPTNKRGPQNFPPIPSFRPYSAATAAPGIASMVNRLRTTPTGASNAGAGSGASGRGADASGMSIQGIQGIQGIPTSGSLSDTLGVAPPQQQLPDNTSVSPDSPDQTPPPQIAQQPGTPGAGTVDSNPVISRLRATQGGQPFRRGPQY